MVPFLWIKICWWKHKEHASVSNPSKLQVAISRGYNPATKDLLHPRKPTWQRKNDHEWVDVSPVQKNGDLPTSHLDFRMSTLPKNQQFDPKNSAFPMGISFFKGSIFTGELLVFRRFVTSWNIPLGGSPRRSRNLQASGLDGHHDLTRLASLARKSWCHPIFATHRSQLDQQKKGL